MLAERTPEVCWVVPSVETDFYEPRDKKMLEELGLKRLAPALADFWPARGPVWDALARCTFAGGLEAVILAEGKNYPREMYSGGTQAGKSGSEETKASRHKIELAIAWTQGQLGLGLDVGRWLDPNESGASLYQTANRLATVIWLRSQGIEAWLCHLLYVGDKLHQPTSRASWEEGLHAAEEELGIAGIEIPFAGHAFLEALDPERELQELRGQPRDT